MAKRNQITDLFRAAADIEAATPITVGATKCAPNLQMAESQRTSPQWREWVASFPIREMRRLRFSLPKGVPDVDAVLGFFGVSSPERWDALWQPASIALRQTKQYVAPLEAVAAWIREAEIIANEIQLADYDEGKLRSSLNDLRQLTRKRIDVGLEQAQRICSQAGVALVIVPELPGTRLSGCARWLSDKHALVGLTTRYKKDDQLWFTFFHELGHILLHRKELAIVVDNAAQYMGDGVVDPMMVRFEQEADHFASITLIPQGELTEFLRAHGRSLSNDNIHDFAVSVGIGPGIVVGRLQHDRVLDWHQGNSLKQSIDWDFVSED